MDLDDSKKQIGGGGREVILLLVLVASLLQPTYQPVPVGATIPVSFLGSNKSSNILMAIRMPTVYFNHILPQEQEDRYTITFLEWDNTHSQDLFSLAFVH